MVFKYFFGEVVGWVGGLVGWLEKWGLKLISTQVVVEVGIELGNICFTSSLRVLSFKRLKILYFLQCNWCRAKWGC